MVNINTNKLQQSLSKYGSLEKSIEQLSAKNKSLLLQNSKLTDENEDLKRDKKDLTADVDSINVNLEHRKEELQKLDETYNIFKRQYNLFQALMAMLGSAAISKPISYLVGLLQELAKSTFYFTKDNSDLRSLFIQEVLGDYLKCYYCDSCGASFLVNKDPKDTFFNRYTCPACHQWFYVKSNDFFVKVMVSEQQIENIATANQLKAKLNTLENFEAFIGLPCKVCKKPVTEWTKNNVKAIIEELGVAHDKCWQEPLGQVLIHKKAFEKGIEK